MGWAARWLFLPGSISPASLSFDCSSLIHSQTSNPLNLNKISACVSEGGGAPLAEGGSILGVGIDTGGSMHTPALVGGVYGLWAAEFCPRYLLIRVAGYGHPSLEQPEMWQ